MHCSMNEAEADILIVGAGPVGMTLALDLESRGISTIVIEQHAADAPPIPRCNHISSHTLEVFRRLGFASDIRNVGLPGSFPHDVAFSTSLTGHEFGRIRIPSRDDRFSEGDYADSGWPTAEPPHRCNQMFFEPVLRSRLAAASGIRVMYDTRVENVSQDESGTSAIGRNSVTGDTCKFQAKYLVGCDGGSSLARKLIGARFEGDELVALNRTIFVHAPKLLEDERFSPAWMTLVFNPRTRGFGTVVAIDGIGIWGFNLRLPAAGEGFTDIAVFDIDRAVCELIGKPLEYELISTDDWASRRLVADKLRDRRIFICGDAAHIWTPSAGYGMNAGIADAATLAWQLAGVIQGWGGPALLDAYEIERLPVTEQVSKHAMELALRNLATDLVHSPSCDLELSTPAGDAARAAAGKVMIEINTGQFACIGLNFGSHYDTSPIISYDGVAAPYYNLSTYQPSTTPGCRTPHYWVADGHSLYDAIGSDYALIRSDPTIDVTVLLDAAAERGMPLRLIDRDISGEDDVYDHNLVISRPDRYTAWRGPAVPVDPFALIDKIRGIPIEA